MNKKSCEFCKFREFEMFGWYCSKKKIFYDDCLYQSIEKSTCKYHKRDASYCLSNGRYKHFLLKSENHYVGYYFKKGRFIKDERFN